MAGRPIQYATIFLTVFINILGFGIVIPVLPLYAEHFGATAIQIGWLVGIFSLMQFVFAPLWGRVSDRVGRKPVLIIGMIGTVVGYLMMGFAGSVLMLFLARMVDGIAGANIGAAQAYLADISPPEKRARAMGLLGAAFGLGFVFGPALGGWASATYHYSTPMFIAAALGIANLFFVTFFLPESLTTPGVRKKFSELLAHIHKGQYFWSLGAYFTVTAGFSMMTSIFALYLLHRFEIDAKGTGFIFGGIGILGVLIQGGLIGRLVKRFGEPNLSIVGTLIMGGGFVGLSLSPAVGPMLLATAAVGIGNSLLMPSLSSLASRAADAEWQGRALGLLQSCGSLARFLGPLTAGIMLAFENITPTSPYASWPLMTAGGILLVSLFVAIGLRAASMTKDTLG